jgi:hypothetical protein
MDDSEPIGGYRRRQRPGDKGEHQMRVRASVKIDLPGGESKIQSPIEFWSSFAQYVDVPVSTHADDYLLVVMEARLRSGFASEVEGYLRRHAPDVTVLIKDISYGSLNISLDMISNTMSTVGLTPDDLITLLARYTPIAMLDTLAPFGRRPGLSLSVIAGGQVVDDNQNGNQSNVAGDGATARLAAIWSIANTSLVVPALILVVAAYFLFQAVGEERGRLTSALVDERKAIADERNKIGGWLVEERKAIAAEQARIAPRYDSLLDSFQKHLTDDAKRHFSLSEIDEETLKARLEQVKSKANSGKSP